MFGFHNIKASIKEPTAFENWIIQDLDHFDPLNNKTYNMVRFFENCFIAFKITY